MERNTISAAGAPVPGRQPFAWMQLYPGAAPIDELDLCRDMLRTVWLSLHADEGWLGKQEIKSIRNIVYTVLDGLDALRPTVDSAPEDRP